MLKKLLKLSATLALMILLSASSVLASGKMEVKLGDKVSLQAEDFSGGTFKWVARKGKEIITTQSTSLFNYTFNQQGEYEVVLTITDAAGKTKSTTVFVLVGNRYSTRVDGSDVEGGILDVPLSVGLSTLPTRTSQRTVHILGDEGRVVFEIGAREDILEYRIDRNIFVDSDGNGIANDDIDNADHSSYLLGGLYQTKYLASESNKIAAEVTIVNKIGQKAKSQVEIIFDSVPSKEGNVVAVLDTLPLLDEQDKKVYIYDDLDTVAFYPRRSQGDIIEYRIDKNIFVDSDGDGNPENDIDNRTDNSFKTGDVWTTAYNKTDDQIIAQLIVVGKGGSGSRIQREIDFTDRPIVTVPDISTSDSVIRLASDKEFVQKGDPINFAVEGLAQSLSSYTFGWDFDGDGEIDQTSEGDNTISYIYDEPGIQLVKVSVQDTDGNEASFNLDVLVKDVAETTADFEFVTEGNKVTFTNLSVVSPNLTSKSLGYTWNFGDTDPDNYEAQKDQIGVQNPTYTYVNPGTYIVTLTVVDIDQVSNTKTTEVVVEGGVEGGEVAEEVLEGEKVEKEGSLIGTIFKVILYIILVVVFLVMLIVLGLLAFLKIQHPDLVFEELIDELKIKLLGMMGFHDMIEPTEKPEAAADTPEQHARAAAAKQAAAEEAAESAPEPAPEQSAPEAAPAEEAAETEVAQEPEPESETEVAETADEPAEEPSLAQQDAPVPDWLKDTASDEVPTEKPEVIEGEIEEESPSEESQPEEDTITLDEAEIGEEEASDETVSEPEPESEVAEAEPAPQEPTPETIAEPAPEEPTQEELAPEAPTDAGTEGEGEQNKEDGPVPDWLKNA